ncbi:MAG: hypothetical protein ACKVQK_07850 [Burkholderiales bacterium]
MGRWGVAHAQAYKPGDKLEYKTQNSPEKWEPGTFVRELPGGTQVLIRQAPSQFFPQGSERAYSLNEVRLVGGAPAANPPQSRPGPAIPPAPTAQVAKAAPEPAPGIEPPPQAGAAAGAPMSQQDVLGFLQTRLGDGDPFANPRREAVLQQLRDEILRRGVGFRYATLGDFSNRLGKYGALSNVTAPLAQNFGAPASSAELSGKWRLLKVGATTTFAKGNDLYRRGEFAGDAGTLVVNADASYVWNSPSGLLKGKWRPATAGEMAKSDKGGEGVVLVRAKSGADWLVFRRNEEGPEGNGILIADLATRNLRERGTR